MSPDLDSSVSGFQTLFYWLITVSRLAGHENIMMTSWAEITLMNIARG